MKLINPFIYFKPYAGKDNFMHVAELLPIICGRTNRKKCCEIGECEYQREFAIAKANGIPVREDMVIDILQIIEHKILERNPAIEPELDYSKVYQDLGIEFEVIKQSRYKGNVNEKLTWLDMDKKEINDPQENRYEYRKVAVIKSQTESKKDMNELENKIWALIGQYKFIVDEDQIKNLSKFFLEEIKEAYIAATNEVLSENVYSPENVEKDAEDYLKSKYNITN